MIITRQPYVSKLYKTQVQETLKSKPEYIAELKKHFNVSNGAGWPLNYHIFLDSYKIEDCLVFLNVLSAINLKVVYFDGQLLIIRGDDEIETN